MERHSYGRALRMAAAPLFVPRQVWSWLRGVEQRGGVFQEGATGSLRRCPGAIRNLCHALGRSKDDDSLDDEQSLAIVLRASVRRLLQAGWRVFWSQEGAASDKCGLGLLRR